MRCEKQEKRQTMKKKYNYAFFDEGSKREIRRSILKAIA
ncbi:MAG: alpha-D-ribose 1-methylphosphonate 5-phosphate C-P-lyase PhnJ, partial [Longicatena sp.]